MDDLKNAGAIAANLGLTKRSLREINALASILERGPTFAELAYQHTVLCQIGLPRRKVEGDHFLRRSGNAELAVSAGFLFEGNRLVKQPVPFGSLPRLALAHVSTFAVQNRTPEVPIGDSASQFLRRIGSGSGRGPRTAGYVNYEALPYLSTPNMPKVPPRDFAQQPELLSGAVKKSASPRPSGSGRRGTSWIALKGESRALS